MRIFGRFADFEQALAGSSDGRYLLLGAGSIAAQELARIAELSVQRGHAEYVPDDRVREAALAAIRAFFEACADCDPRLAFAFSSKVPLAVPGYRDLQQLFLARAAKAGELPPVLVFAPEPWITEAAACLEAVPGESSRHVAPGTRARLRFLRTLMRTLARRAPAGQADILLFTLSGDTPGSDPYFGPLATWLSPRSVATAYLASGATVGLPADAGWTPLEAFAGPLDAIGAWRESSGASLASLPADLPSAALARLLARREVEAGDAFLHAFLARAFRAMLAHVRPRVLVYPFENRTWEKALVRAAREQGVGRVVGYQHSSLTPRHLAFETAGSAPGEALLPDRIVTVGEVTARWIGERAPALAARLKVGASLRRSRTKLADPTGEGVLVAISSSRDEALALMRGVHSAAPRLALPVVIRSHPTIRADDLFARFRWPGNVRLSGGTSLDEDLAQASIVAYSSSTVCLEGMLCGRLPLYVDIGDLPSADPLIGECPAKFSVEAGGDLAASVRSACAIDGARLARMREEARRYAEAYLREASEERVRDIVDVIAGGPA